MKTGFYLALGMVGGAMIAGANDEAIARLWRFGTYAGPAFQVRDDVLDLTPGKGRGGRIGSDIAEGKASILYAHALIAASPEDRARLVHVMSLPRRSTSPDDVRWVMDLYEKCGTLEFARRYSVERLALAKAEILALPLVKDELLTDLTDYVIDRST
jgi:geranylgeranyl pyrophosphate synthase